MITLYFSVFVAMLGLGIISPLLPAFAKDFGASGLWVGLIFSGFAISRIIVIPISGTLSDKIGRKIFIASGFLILTIASILYLFANNVYTLTAVRLLHGAGAGLITPVAMAYAADCAVKGREARTMSTLTMMLYFGLGAGPLLGGFLLHLFGISSVFYIMAGLSLFTFFAVVVFLSEPARRVPDLLEKEYEGFLALIKRPGIRLILIIILLGSFRAATLMSFLPSLAESLHIDPSGSGIIIATAVLLAGVLLPFFGRIADRLSKTGKLIQILTGGFIGTFGLLAIPFCRSFSPILAIAVILGIASAISVSAAAGVSVIIGQRVGMGSWMGIYNTTTSLGIVTAPLATGLTMDSFGIKPAFCFAAMISLLGVLLACYFFFRWLKSHSPV